MDGGQGFTKGVTAVGASLYAWRRRQKAVNHGRADQPRGLALVPRNAGKERCPIVDTWWQTEPGDIGDTSTLAEPAVVEQIVEGHQARQR